MLPWSDGWPPPEGSFVSSLFDLLGVCCGELSGGFGKRAFGEENGVCEFDEPLFL